MTALEVFNRAMSLIDEISEETYLPDPSDTQEYKAKAKLIINILSGNLYKYSDTCKSPRYDEKGKLIKEHPYPTQLTLNDLSEEVDLDDYIAGSILPYGLAAALIADENQELSQRLDMKYQEGFTILQTGGISSIEMVEDIYDPYGANSYFDTFGSWW